MRSVKTHLIIFLLAQIIFLNVTPSAHAETPLNDPTPTGYDLTYPGLLPDHPLYFLKVARDSLMEFFKGKPLDKASFALLQADKNLAASEVLITQKQRPDLAFVTLDASHESLSDAITQTIAAKKEGLDIHEMCQKLKGESIVQIQVLTAIKDPLIAKDASKYAAEKAKIEELTQTIATLKP